MSNSFEAAFQFGNPSSAKPRDPEEPMRILVLGNFSGRRSQESLADRKFYRVDIDNFQEFVEKLAPTAHVSLGDDQAIEIEISELDDFNPDALYRNVPVFAKLRDLRKRLRDNSSFSQAAAELTEALSIRSREAEPETKTELPAKEVSDSSESDSDTLDRVLGQSPARVETSGPKTGQIDLDRLIQDIVAPYIEPKADPRQDEFVGHVDSAIAAQMKTILHDRSFQELEAAWLALDFLVREVASSIEVQVFVWDVTKAELLAAGESESDQLEDSLLFRRLVTDREQIPFSMLVCNESFGYTIDDLILLTRLGAIGANSGGPVLAGASSTLVGAESWTEDINLNASAEASLQEENWQSIRTSPVARWIGLSGPRFLLRLPYGASRDSIDAFDFEEVDDPIAEHTSLLWGNPSFVVATLLASSFLENGWSMNPGDRIQIDDLPGLTYEDEGETHLKSCAEVFLSERVADHVLNLGVMPLLGFKNRNAIRVLRIQSVSSPAGSLAGPWSS